MTPAGKIDSLWCLCDCHSSYTCLIHLARLHSYTVPIALFEHLLQTCLSFQVTQLWSSLSPWFSRSLFFPMGGELNTVVKLLVLSRGVTGTWEEAVIWGQTDWHSDIACLHLHCQVRFCGSYCKCTSMVENYDLNNACVSYFYYDMTQATVANVFVCYWEMTSAELKLSGLRVIFVWLQLICCHGCWYGCMHRWPFYNSPLSNHLGNGEGEAYLTLSP